MRLRCLCALDRIEFDAEVAWSAKLNISTTATSSSAPSQERSALRVSDLIEERLHHLPRDVLAHALFQEQGRARCAAGLGPMTSCVASRAGEIGVTKGAKRRRVAPMNSPLAESLPYASRVCSRASASEISRNRPDGPSSLHPPGGPSRTTSSPRSA